MQQLSLFFKEKPKPTFENFYVGKNKQIINLLKISTIETSKEKFFFIYGPSGSGKSHVGISLYQQSQKKGLKSYFVLNSYELDKINITNSPTTLIIDGFQWMSDTNQRKLLLLFDDLRSNGGIFLGIDSNPPASLQIRNDLKTRIKWCLIYELLILDDVKKKEVLKNYAKEYGFNLPIEVFDYILFRKYRNLGYLVELLDAIYRFSIKTKRRITIPLVKDLLTIIEKKI